MAIEGGANLIGSTYNGNDNNALNTYAKLYQQQQAKVANEQKELAAKLSSIKTDGLREADRADYNKMYSSWRDKSILASKERDQFKKSQLLADADKEYMGLNQLVGDSKQGGAQLHDVFKSQLGKNPFDTYEEADWNKIKASDSLPISDPNFVKNPYDIQARPDYSKTISLLDGFDKGLEVFKKDTGKRTVTDFIAAGKKRSRETSELAVDPKLQAEKYTQAYDLSPVFARGIRALYPQLDWMNNPDQSKAQAIQDLVGKRRLVYQSSASNFSPDEPKTGGSVDSDVIQIDNSNNTIPISDKNVTAKNIIRISPTAVNLGGLTAYDADSDEAIKIPNVEGGVKIANMAYYPFMKDATTVNRLTGKKTSVSGKLAQSEYANKNPNNIDYKAMALVSYTVKVGKTDRQKNVLVPVDDLPKDKKDIQKRVQALKSNQPQSNQSKGAIYKTKKYGNFTEADLKAQYGDAWKEALKKLQ